MTAGATSVGWRVDVRRRQFRCCTGGRSSCCSARCCACCPGRRSRGCEHVPTHGGAILASNHLAVADSFFLPLLVPRRITFLAKREYFTQPGLIGRLKKIVLHRGRAGAGGPLRRVGGAGRDGHRGPAAARGKLLGIYPEGTRSPDGRLYKGKTGVARMALEAGVPVIPVAMIGTDKVNPIGSRMWRPHQVHIRIGEPLDFSRYAGMAGDRFIERSMTDEIMYALMELSGQTYVDVYAASVKERAARRAAGPDAGEIARAPSTRAG